MAEHASDSTDYAKRRVGEVVAGRWELMRLVGIGGMAAVYETRDDAGKPAAIKVLHSEFSSNENIKGRFLREASLTAAVEHPGRVAIFEQGVSEQGDPYFVMELLVGVTLDRLWKRHDKKLPVPYALEIADRVLEFLAECHAAEIVHRDLKPSNVFVTEEGFVKVIDFGVARRREEGVDPTLVGTALGTPAYMAPEQALGSSERVDARSDIFSVGAVLHAMISGKRLHEGRSHQEAFVLAATRPAPSVARVAPDLPPEVVALVDRALAWDPRNRFQTAAQMREQIASALAGIREGNTNRPVAMASAKAAMLAAIAESGAEAVHASTDAHQQEAAPVLEVFNRVEKALATVRQYGWEHPVSEGHMRTVKEVVERALQQNPEGVSWDVRPHSFTCKGVTVWEPLHPFDDIPYNLFASGFREFSLTPGITVEEIAALLDLMRQDPLRDFAPEDDLATAFWERRLDHVKYRVVQSFLAVAAADDTTREAYDEIADQAREVMAGGRRRTASGPLELSRQSLEERAAVIAARQLALRAVRSDGALALEPAKRKLIARSLDMSEEEWTARFVAVLAHAISDARAEAQLDLAVMPLCTTLHEHAAADTLMSGLSLVARVMVAVVERDGRDARRDVVQAVFDEATFTLVLKLLARPTPESERERLAQAAPFLDDLLGDLDREHFRTVLEALSRTDVDEIREALGRYLERHALGNESALGRILEDAELAKGRAVLAILGRLDSDAAREALKHVEQNPSTDLRVEAVAVRAANNAEGLRDELANLSRDPDPLVRVAALATMRRYKVKEAGPSLVQHVTSSGFSKLSIDERRLAFDALWALSPARAEAVAIELVSKVPLITRESVDDTRIIAIEFLAQFGQTTEVADTLEKASGKWSNSAAVRAAAARARTVLSQRLGGTLG